MWRHVAFYVVTHASERFTAPFFRAYLSPQNLKIRLFVISYIFEKCLH